MGKNNARSLKIPSASWIRNVIKEEVKAQLEERESEQHGLRYESMDRPQRGGFMDEPMSESMDEGDGWNEWWDGPRSSENSERKERPEPGRRTRAMDKNHSEGKEGSAWSFWSGDFMSDPIMEEGSTKRARNQDWESAVEKEIEASISPVEQPRPRRRQRATKAKRR